MMRAHDDRRESLCAIPLINALGMAVYTPQSSEE